MPFKKGQPGYWTGKKRGPLSSEWRKNVSRSLKGRIVTEQTREKLRNLFKGRTYTIEQRKRMSISHMGIPHPHTKEQDKHISEALKRRAEGNKIKINGYIHIKKHNHPSADSNNYIPEHRLVMEKNIGRYLTKKEIVHHINEIRDDNRIENLLLLPNRSAHGKLHGRPPKGKARKVPLNIAH